MNRDTTICKRIITLSEQIAIHKIMNEKHRLSKFVYSRINNPPPSHIFISEMIEESHRLINEMEQDIKKLVLPLLKGMSFDITTFILSSRDIYRGYIELYDDSNKQYVLFLKSYKNGLVDINEGSLILNDTNQITSVLQEMVPVKKSPVYKTLLEVLLSNKK